MTAYGPLAAGYDALTGDVPYNAFADWYETAFARKGGAVQTVLDLGCGTGTLSLILAGRGYEMICTDASPDMLAVFQQKVWELPEDTARPLLLCQRSEELVRMQQSVEARLEADRRAHPVADGSPILIEGKRCALRLHEGARRTGKLVGEEYHLSLPEPDSDPAVRAAIRATLSSMALKRIRERCGLDPRRFREASLLYTALRVEAMRRRET